MIAARIDFGRLVPDGPQRENQFEAVSSYLDSLWKNGCRAQSYVLSRENEHLLAYVDLSREEALDEQFSTEWTRRSLNEAQEAFGSEITVQILDETPGKTCEATWETAGSLILYTSYGDDGSPVIRGDDGVEVALFRLPLDQETLQDLQYWALCYRSMDVVWILNRDLEVPAYKQLVEPKGCLQQQGRDLAQTIEEKTSLPTYSYLMRFWGRRLEEQEQARVCPSCGEPWFIGESDDSGLRSFPFRCDPCRLVSGLPTVTVDERHARLGEYRPPR